MQICNNCNHKLPSDNLNFCTNCGHRLKWPFHPDQKPNKIKTMNRLRKKKLTIPIMAVLFIAIMVFWIFIIPQINIDLTIKKPVLESITPISPIVGDSYQYLDFFNNSIYEYQAYPASIIVASFNANDTAIVSETTYPLIYNTGLSALNGITKFTTNGNSSFVLTNWDHVPRIYKVITSNGQYQVGNQLNISCTQSNIFPSSTSYCEITDIQVIGSNLFILAVYYHDSNLELLGNIVKVYDLITNKITNVYSFPEKNSGNVDIGIYQGGTSNELLLNYENIFSLESGTLGEGNFGFYKIDLSSVSKQNYIQYSILSSTYADLNVAGIILSNMIYHNGMLQIFYYNENSNLIYQFATYKLQNLYFSNDALQVNLTT